jgi:hypothetical protein
MAMPGIRPDPASPRQSQDRLALVGVLFLTFVVHAASPVITSTDSAWTFHVAASILQEGDVDLDEYRAHMDLELDYRLRLFDDHVYYYYPAATPLLVTPVVILANAVLPLLRGADFFSYLSTHGPNDRTARLEKLAASAFVALAAALMYLVVLRAAGIREAIATALILAFATSMWSTASRALWQHGPSVVLALSALYLTLAAPQRLWAVLAAGALLAFAYLVRPTNSLSFAFFGLYYLLNQPRRAWAYAVGGLAILLPYAILNLTVYGNVFPPYSYQLFERVGQPADIAEAFVGTLLSPNRGLFIWTPIFLFAVLGAILEVRRLGSGKGNLALYLVGILLSHWIVTSLFEDWGGAWSIGPRYFVDIIPYLTYFLVPILGSLPSRTTAFRYAFVLAMGASIVIQLYCAVSPYPFLWNGKPKALVEAPERKWDWGDLQFLRGSCPGEPLEGRAPACWVTSLD